MSLTGSCLSFLKWHRADYPPVQVRDKVGEEDLKTEKQHQREREMCCGIKQQIVQIYRGGEIFSAVLAAGHNEDLARHFETLVEHSNKQPFLCAFVLPFTSSLSHLCFLTYTKCHRRSPPAVKLCLSLFSNPLAKENFLGVVASLGKVFTVGKRTVSWKGISFIISLYCPYNHFEFHQIHFPTSDDLSVRTQLCMQLCWWKSGLILLHLTVIMSNRWRRYRGRRGEKEEYFSFVANAISQHRSQMRGNVWVHVWVVFQDGVTTGWDWKQEAGLQELEQMLRTWCGSMACPVCDKWPC